ncbi:MAG TPA: hypothetical protein VFB62_18730 [Polyangiaceae bacterium]|jgi:hypothetical protein|nr:hypothetical protein [Polyangiaceae bacterium]
MKSGALLIVALLGTGAFAFAWGGRDSVEPSEEPSEETAAPAQRMEHPEGALPQDLPPGHPPIDQGAGLDEPLPAGHPPIGDEQPAEAATRVEPAKNGRTVAQIVRDARTLEGKKVRVAARVMRSTPNVLGRTWLRVQDGSGQASSRDHELVVTTQATPAVGDVVELEGTVVRDKDLGSGYRYDVLLEDATVAPR